MGKTLDTDIVNKRAEPKSDKRKQRVKNTFRANKVLYVYIIFYTVIYFFMGQLGTDTTSFYCYDLVLLKKKRVISPNIAGDCDVRDDFPVQQRGL